MLVFVFWKNYFFFTVLFFFVTGKKKIYLGRFFCLMISLLLKKSSSHTLSISCFIVNPKKLSTSRHNKLRWRMRAWPPKYIPPPQRSLSLPYQTRKSKKSIIFNIIYFLLEISYKIVRKSVIYTLLKVKCSIHT